MGTQLELPVAHTDHPNQPIPTIIANSHRTPRSTSIAYKYRTRLKYTPENPRLMLQQIQVMDEEYDSILLQQQKGIGNYDLLLNHIFEIDQQTTNWMHRNQYHKQNNAHDVTHEIPPHKTTPTGKKLNCTNIHLIQH